MKRLLTLIALLAVTVLNSYAKVELAPLFADNMVLQRDSEAAIWGKAEPGARVVITSTWAKGKTVVHADDQGRWNVMLATPSAGGPHELTFNDGDRLTLKNILIGEVWICAGQSNMEMTMRGFMGQPVEGAAELILTAKPSVPIRSCNLSRIKSLELEEECDARWFEHTSEGVAEASATAYFFAKRLCDVLGVPVGIINVSWGGSPIEAWMNPELLRREFAEEFSFAHLDSMTWPEENPWKAPGVLYNGMLHSVAPYTAKGFLWYQGCDNISRYEQYKRLQPAFVKMLRQEWGNDRMPFYFTQIAPYGYFNPDAPDAGYMMWAQAQTLEMIPYSGMAATHDVGEVNCIHPADKKSVGDRLAFLALVNDYGYEGIDAATPIPIDFKFEEGQAIVTFEAGYMGLSPLSKDVDGFELAGEDGIFYPAKGIVLWNNPKKVLVYKCPQVQKPVAVRYGMKNWSEATVFNCFGVPISPFRSDNY
ncbi:MAG: sialate O-acetylesterase [Bacteroidales bacterium]|nr:sialate O-acetylesterase [Bacteroidales bacterium]